MPTLNKYIAIRVLISIFLAFVVITSIIMLVDFVETSRNLGSESDASMVAVLYLTFLNMPMLVEKTIPFVVLFGVMGAYFLLNRHSELIVLRASGLSVWRFLRPAIIVTALLGVLWAMAFNPLAALSQHKHKDVMNSFSVDGAVGNIKEKDIWLREGSEGGYVVIHAASANIEKHLLFDVTFYTLNITPDDNIELSTRFDAKKAELAKNGYWILTTVIENEDGNAPRKYQSISRTTTINWETLRARSQSGKSPQFWQIQAEIQKARNAGFDATRLIMHLHKLLALPLTLIAMAVIAAGASLNMAREGGTLRLLISGSALGFGVYFIDNLIGAFGETGTLPPVVAAWSVPLLVLSCGLVFLSWVEDG